jgi:hypothetical protein
MAVFALWSAPRARSTAFFRSMAERGDVTVLHEPFCNLKDYGETDVGGRTFDSAGLLLAWLRDEAHDRDVFFKDTMDHQHDEVLADRSFLAEAHHAFLIRRPEEIAASYYALFPPMTINAIGMERLCEMQAAISDAGGNPPIVIDSDDLVARSAATMAAYCTAVGLPFNSRALTWERGEQAEWQRTARWHTAVNSQPTTMARRSHSLPFLTYSRLGGLRQDPGRAAESAGGPRTDEDMGGTTCMCCCRPMGTR